MALDKLVDNDYIVSALAHATHSGDHGLDIVPSLLKRVITEDCWQERQVQVLRGAVARFERFEEFVTAPPPEGLRTSVKTLRRLCADDPEALDLIDQALQRTRGRPSTKGVNQSNFIIDSGSAPGSGRDRSGQRLRRLRKDRPDLHQQVLAGELTINGAATAARIYPRRVSVNLDSPASAARTLRRATTAAFLRELATLLSSTESA